MTEQILAVQEMQVLYRRISHQGNQADYFGRYLAMSIARFGHTGCAPAKYIHRTRLVKAALRLKTDHMKSNDERYYRKENLRT